MNIVYRDQEENKFDIFDDKKFICKGELLDMENDQDPREWDSPSRIITGSRNYCSIDKPKHIDDINCWADIVKEAAYELGVELEEYDISIEETTEKLQDKAYIWPVFAYEHSSISYSLLGGYPYDCPWDGGITGIAFIEKSVAEKEWSGEKNMGGRCFKFINAELDVYNNYANGYTVERRITLYDQDGIELYEEYVSVDDDKEDVILKAIKEANNERTNC